ncbi:unnamed protein product, partial [Rotaria sp. Silwood1]
MWRRELQAALNITNVSEKASKLASIVRRVMNEADSDDVGERRKLSRDDKKALQEAAEHVLESDLLNLLKEMCAVEIAIELVRAFITNRDCLAQTIVNSNCSTVIKLNENLVKNLKTKLETRGLLLNNGIEGVEWFDQFCNEFPTMAKLQGHKWSDIQAIVVNQSYGYSNAENKVLDLWSRNRPIRLAIIRYNLPPWIAEALEQNGIADPNQITYTHANELVQKTNDSKIKANIMRLWSKESTQGKNRSNECEEKRKNQKQRIDEANKTINDLRNELSNNNNVDKEMIQQRLNDITQKLNINTWKFNESNTITMDKLREELRMIESDLSGASNDIDLRIGSYKSDEELVSFASAGLALYGLNFGIDATSFGRKAAHPILDQPDYCPIRSSSEVNVKAHIIHFSSVDAASNFRTTMESAGHTIAFGLKASGWGFSVSGDCRNVTETNRTETDAAAQLTNSASTMSYQIFSIGSFRIPKSQMKLTVDAESDAKAITTMALAKQFLMDYGSHVSDGIHHFGGILCRISEVHSCTKHSFQQLKDIASSQISSNANVGYSNVGFNGGISVSTTSFNTTGLNTENTTTSVQVEIQTRVEIHGPSTTNPDLFNKILQTNNKTWHIIDRSNFSSLVPIWTIMNESSIPEIQQAAALVRTAWIQQAQSFSHIPEISQELQRARIDKFSLFVGNSLTNNEWLQNMESTRENTNNWFDSRYLQQTKECVIEQAQILVRKISQIDLNRLEPNQIQEIVIDLFRTLYYFSYRSHANVFLELMKQDLLPTFLNTIATYHDERKVSSTQKFLREIIFDEQTRQLLDHAHISLHVGIIQMLTRTSNYSLENMTSCEHVWDVPSIPLAGLPSYLTGLKSKIMDGIEAADVIKLNQRLSDVLSKNIVEYGQNNRILAVLERYGWQESSFAATLTEEHIQSLIEALEMKLSGANVITHAEQANPLTISSNEDVQRNVLDDELASSSKLVVDRSTIVNPTDATANKWLIDSLRHRLDLQQNIKQQNTTEHEPNDFFNIHNDNNNSVNTYTNRLTKSVYDVLIDVLKTFNTTGKLEIFQLLLERRSALPILTFKSENCFNYHGTLLDLLQINLGKDRLQLGRNTNLFRIAVISNRSQLSTETHIWLRDIFGIHSLYKIDNKSIIETTIGELGIGFLETEPCIVLHIIGDWKPLQSFIEIFANWILIEGASIQEMPVSKTAITVVWDYNDTNSNGSTEERTQPYKHYFIKGSLSVVSEKLRNALIKGQTGHIKKPTKISEALHSITMPNKIEPDLANPIDIPCALMQTDFSNIRNTSCLFQNSFKRQATSELQLFSPHALNNPAQRATLEDNIKKEIRYRMNSSSNVEKLDIIKLFIGILKQPDPVTRIIAFRRFEEILNENCEPHLKQRQDIETGAWIRYEDEVKRQKTLPEAKSEIEVRNRKTTLEYYSNEWRQARIVRNNAIIASEHCWRELSHLYAANPKRHCKLPKLASRFLQDGFNLELMDGDAAMINIEWIKAVLIQLEEDLLIKTIDNTHRKPRIFVLSILGVQSCGKSTFLNLMFGTRFRTSVGMCTRGVNMQLVKVEDRKEYDYILLLDTEGIRAPESIGLPDSHLRDNRMATLALLPADATIILNKGETDEAVKELLPVVVKAYLDSKLAETNGGRFSTNIFFVYNQIDISQAHLLGQIERKLVVALREESEKAVSERQAEQQESRNQSDQLNSSRSYMDCAFRDFQHNVNDKTRNDIRVLGNLKHGNIPPHDLPDATYGNDIMELREHIHRRVTALRSWKPRDLSTIAKYIDLVWDCIVSSNFQLNFSTAVQRIAHAELEKELSDIERNLNCAYDTYFQILEEDINSLDPSSPIDISVKLSDYSTKLESNVSEKRQELSSKVKKMLDDPRWIQWQNEKLISWNTTVKQQQDYWECLLKEKMDGVFNFRKYLNEYKNAMYEHAEKLFAGNTEEAIKRRAWSLNRKQSEFETLFSKQLERARQEHRPLADQVQRKITEVYARNTTMQVRFNANDNKKHTLRKLWDNVTTKAASFSHVVKEALITLTGGITQDESDEQLIQTLISQVNRSLQNTEHYSDSLVQDAINMTRNALKNDTRDSIHNYANLMVSSLLVSRLTEIQKRWDEKNCVSKKFEKEKDDLWSYFQNVGNNLERFALLSKTLCTMFQRHIPEAFTDALATYVCSILRGKNWLTNAEILFAYADLKIIEDLQQNRIDDALSKCENTYELSDCVLHRLISKEVQRVVDEQWGLFSWQIKNSLNLSVQKTLSVKSNLVAKFLAELRNELSHLGTGILSNNVPPNPQHYNNCDSDPNRFQSLATEILNELPRTNNFNQDSMSHCTQQILIRLRDRQLSPPVKPRCGTQCPLCHSSCTLELGHPNEQHDTYHQPSGLAGAHRIDDNTLVSDTCADSVKKNW